MGAGRPHADDILVFGKTLKEHDRNVEAVKRRLEEVEFLGYRNGKNKVMPILKRGWELWIMRRQV